MSKIVQPITDATEIADLQARLAKMERIVQSIEGSMISPNTITGGNVVTSGDLISAENINVQDLAAQLIQVGSLIAGNTSGSHLIIDSSGIRAYSDATTQTFNINATTGDAFFAGNIVTAAGSFIAAQNFSLTGTSNVISGGASLAFASSSGVSAPNRPPTVTATWAKTTWQDSVNDRWGGCLIPNGFGTQPTILAWTTYGSGGAYSATRVLKEYDLATLTVQRSLDFGSGVYGMGATFYGDYVYVLVNPLTPQGGSRDTLYIEVIDNQSPDLTKVAGGSMVGLGAPTSSPQVLYPGLFGDGAGHIYVIGTDGTGTNVLKLWQFDVATNPLAPAYVQSFLLDPFFDVKPSIAEISSVVPLKTGGGFGIPGTDAGVLYVSIFEEDKSHTQLDGVYAFDLTTFTALTGKNFGAPGTGDRSYGTNSVDDGAVDLMVYDGTTNMYASVYGKDLGQLTNEYWFTDSALSFGYAWYDGTHDTTESPITTVSAGYGGLPNRSSALVSTSPLPSMVTGVKYFIGSGASNSSTQHLQASDTGLTSGSTTSHTFTTYNNAGAGANGLPTSAFPSSSPGILVMPLTPVAQRPSPTTYKGAMEFNSDQGIIEVSDGSIWIRNGSHQDYLTLVGVLNETPGTQSGLQACNFDPRIGSAISLSNDRQVFVALYWPGGTMNGFSWIQTTTGAYTDVGTSYWLYQISGTSLVAVTDGGSTAASGTFKDATGMRSRAFSGTFPKIMPTGVYYMSILWAQSASPTTPQLIGINPTDASVYNGLGSGQFNLLGGASNTYRMIYNKTGVTGLTGPPPATVTIASTEGSGATTLTNMPWLGLW